MNLLEKIASFIRDHGNRARVDGKSVRVEVEFINVDTGAEGVEVYRVRTFGEARRALGY